MVGSDEALLRQALMALQLADDAVIDAGLQGGVVWQQVQTVLRLLQRRLGGRG